VGIYDDFRDLFAYLCVLPPFGEALVVLALCLMVSYVIRFSPFLAHYLFGVKEVNK